MLCWINGQFVEEQQLLISPFDHGLLYGLSFFETFRTYNGKVVLFQEHYNRLGESLSQYRIKMPYSIIDLQDVITELNRATNGEDAIFRINISAGSKEWDLQTNYEHPTVIIFRKPLQKGRRAFEKSANWLITPRNMYEQEVRNKTPYYGNNVLARLEIENLEKCEGFFITPKGFIAEGITSTIFWAKDNVVYTPSLATGINSTVTRQWFILTAKQLGYRVAEDLFFKSELEDAHECFIANSIEGIIPISNINRFLFLGEDGTVYQRLQQAYIEELLKVLK